MTRPKDPLDQGSESQKGWEEFRVVFSAAFQHLWLLDELKYIAPEYSKTLESRFQTAFYTADLLAEDDLSHDGSVPISDPNEQGMDWYDGDMATLVYDQLFPHGPKEADRITRAYSMVLVGLHSALESYAGALGVQTRGPMPKNIRKFLQSRTGEDLDAGTADLIADCDATRHIIVHNRGIVDETFVYKVKDNTLREGEYRPLKSSNLHAFAQAIWRTAVRLRDAAPNGM